MVYRIRIIGNKKFNLDFRYFKNSLVIFRIINIVIIFIEIGFFYEYYVL